MANFGIGTLVGHPIWRRLIRSMSAPRNASARRKGRALRYLKALSARSVRLAGQDLRDSDLAQPAHRHGDVAVLGRHHVAHDAAAALRDLESLELLGLGIEAHQVVG